MKTNKLLLFLIPLCMLWETTAFAQWSANMEQDQAILSAFYRQVKAEEGESMNKLIIKSALFFLNTPYVGRTLEVGGEEEQLVINLRELDCTTFMEACVVLSRTLQLRTPSFEAYCAQLVRDRYRDGMINGYVSRLHYTTDWIADNAAKGLVEDITGKIGGAPLQLHLSMMSSRPENYPHLKDNPERTARMKLIEEQINKRGNYHYIPKAEIPHFAPQIQSGDILCFVTSTAGLDASHIGIAYWQGETLTFIHASSTAKKVIINPESLSEYCKSISTNTGIIVVRCKDL